MRQQDGELFATEPPDVIRIPQLTGATCHCLRQDGVAESMAVTVVDCFEVVQIKSNTAQIVMVPQSKLGFPVCCLLESSPGKRACQAVVHGKPTQLQFIHGDTSQIRQ